MFHQTFGYYAHGVQKETSILPDSWEKRLIPIKSPNTRGIIGWCLEIHDLVLSKYATSRDRDIEFNKEIIRHKMVQENILMERITLLPLKKTDNKRIIKNILAAFSLIRKKRDAKGARV